MSNSQDKVLKTDDAKPKKSFAVQSSSKSILSTKNRNVLRKAFSAVGIVTKEDRLLKAAETGNVSDVTQLLSAGADVNAQNEHGECALMYASFRGHEAVAAALLQHPTINVNIQDCEGWDALMWSARAGHANIVRLFLVHPETEPDLTNNLGETALMKAAVHDHAEVLRLLCTSYRTTINKTHPDGSHALIWAAAGGSIGCLVTLVQNGADISICDKDGLDALMWGVLVGDLDVVKWLHNNGSDITKKDKVGRSPLIMAAETGNAEIAKYISRQVLVNINDKTKDKVTALMRAAEYSHPRVIDILFKMEIIRVNEQDNHGSTALMYASRRGHSECVRILLQHSSIQPDLCDYEGTSPLMVAAAYGHDEVLTALLLYSASDIRKKSRHGHTALIMAARNGQRTTVQKLLSHSDSNINEVDDQGLTALMWATRQGAVHVVELLLQYKDLKPDQADSEGLTALMWAARCNQIVAVKTLLRDSRVDPLTEDKSGKTAYNWAHNLRNDEIENLLHKYVHLTVDSTDTPKEIEDKYSNETWDVSKKYENFEPEAELEKIEDVEKLLDNGPYISWRQKTGKSSFSWAVEMGQTEVVKIFLKVPSLNVNEVDEESLTPLIVASKLGHVEIVQLLISHNSIDVNAGDANGRTALMYASIFGQLRVLNCLLNSFKIKVNKQDRDGHTALTIAVQSGLYEVTTALLRHPSISPNVTTKTGKTALLYAIESRHDDIAELLIQFPKTYVNVTEDDETPLLIAAGKQGNERITKSLLNHPRILVNKRSNNGKSVLIHATRNNFVRCTKLLLEHKDVDVNIMDNDGKTALMYACILGLNGIVRLLFSHPEINPNILSSRDNNSAALIYAARNDHISILSILVSRRDVTVNICDSFRRTALMHSVHKRSKEAVEVLLERDDIRPNISDVEGKTPLLRALSDCSYDIAMILLAREDIDVNAATLEGKTALMYAAMFPDGIAALRLMLASKAVLINEYDEHKNSALMLASKNGNEEAVVALLERPDLDLKSKDDQGMTSMMWASLLGFRNIVAHLLQHADRMNLNENLSDGATALGLACESGNVDVVQTLTSYPGIDINGWDDKHNERTPLVMALEKSQHECVKILLQHPNHSLSKSGVRPPYLHPTLKSMVSLYRNFSQVRRALVLSAPPPALLLDGVSPAGESCVAAGGEFTSALLSLPRPFQVVHHVLKKTNIAYLNNCLHAFASKMAANEPGVAIVFYSGEISITPNGPCLHSSSDHGTDPLSYPLSSLIDMLSKIPTLILILNVVRIHADEDIVHESHLRSHAECYVLPPLVHTNMAAIGAVMQSKKKVIGTQCSPFIRALCYEVLHGVTLPQLHQRVNSSLLKHEESLSAYSPPTSLAEGASSSSGRTKAFYVSNMNQEWLF